MGLASGAPGALNIPTFENQSPLARDQISVVNNCWSEGSYELGVEALNAFRKGEGRYPTPSHIRHLLALALYPSENVTQPLPKTKSPTALSNVGSRPLSVSAPLSPRKHQAQTEVPSARASQLALELLEALAANTHPTHLADGLNSYVRPACDASEFDAIVSTGKIDGFKSPLALESVQVGRARDCWAMIRDGFLDPKDASSTARGKWMDSDDTDMADSDYQNYSYVASHAWEVVRWWIMLFEMDEAINSAESGAASPSKLLLSHIPAAPRPGAPQNDIQTVVGVIFSALRDSSPTATTFILGRRLLTLLIDATATYAISPGALVRATTDQLQTLTISAFKELFAKLTGPVEPLLNSGTLFPADLYYRFCFCLASCYLSKTGSGVSDIGIFGGTDPSSGRGPKARPMARPVGMSQAQTADVTSRQTLEPYPSPSLDLTLAVLRSTPNSEGLKSESLARALAMRAIARRVVVENLDRLLGCETGNPWIPDNDLPNWKAATGENVRLGFEADVQGGAETLEDRDIWQEARSVCSIICESWL